MTPPSPAQLPPKDKKRTAPWIVERMLQRAQPHLSETYERRLTPWLVLGGVLLCLVIGIAVVLWTRGGPEVGSAAATPISSPSSLSTPTESHAIAAPSPLIAATRTATPLASPTPTATLKPSPVPTPTLIKYQVQAGDTLSSIAQHYGITVDAIMRMNGLHSETIYIGQMLTIPHR